MSQQPIHVLLVEDNPDQSELIQRVFKRHSPPVRVTPVTRGDDCLDMLRQNSYSAVLLDYSLPGMDGLTVLREIRQRGYSLPVIMVTGQGDERVAVEAMREGASDYLIKTKRYLTTLPSVLFKTLKQHELTLENARLFDKTKDSLERIQALREIEQAMTSTLDLRSVLGILLEKIDSFLSYSVIMSVRLLRKETGELEPIVFRNVDEKGWKAHGWGAGKHGFTRMAYNSKAPLVVRNVQTDVRTPDPEFFLKQGIVSYLGVPLIATGETLGVLSIYTEEERQFSNEEVDFLTALAGQAAIAIHNSQLYEQVKRKTHELSALYSVADSLQQSLDLDVVLSNVTQKVLDILPFDAARIYFLDQRGEELRLRSYRGISPEFASKTATDLVGVGINGHVVATGEPVVFEDIQTSPQYGGLAAGKAAREAGFHAYISMPLKSKTKTLGVMNFLSYQGHKFMPNEIALLASMVGQIAVAVENANLFEETKARAKQLSAVYSVAAVVNQSLDIDFVLQNVMYRMLWIFEFDAARIYLLGEDGKDLRLMAHKGFPKDALPPSSYRPGQGILGRSFETGKPLFFEDIPNDPDFRRLTFSGLSMKAGFRATFLMPIKVKAKTVGVMNFFRKTVYRFSLTESQLIQSIADHLGTAVENATLYQESRRREEMQGLLKELSQDITSLGLDSLLKKLTEKVRELFKVDVADVRVIEEGKTRVKCLSGIDPDSLPPTQTETLRGRLGWIVKNRKALMIADITRDQGIASGETIQRLGIHGYLGVPLFSKDGEVVGALRALSYQPREFTQEEIDLLQQMANGAAIAIENAKLFQETERRARELFTLHSVTTAVSGSLDIDQVLKKALDAVLEVTGMESGYIRLLEGNPPKLIFRVHRGLSPDFVEELQRGTRAGGKAEQVFSTKQPIILENIPTQHTGDLRRQTLAEGFTATAWVPIMSKEKVVGIINVGTRGAQTFRRDQIPLLESIGASLGVALENAGLYRESQRQQGIQRLLKELSQDITSLGLDRLLKKLTEKVRQLFEVDISDVRILEKGIWRVMGVSGIEAERVRSGATGTGRGRSSWIVKNHRTLLIPDIASETDIPGGESTRRIGIRGYLAVPLFSTNGEAIGVLRALSYQPREFTQEEIDLLQQMANGAAIAIENAQLYEQTKNQAAQLEKDVTQRVQAENQLKQSNTELARSQKTLLRVVSDLRKSHDDLKTTQLQLIQAEKLESVGRLAAGVAHEVKNPLGIILMGAEYLSKNMANGDQNTAMILEEMDHAVRRADAVVKGLLDFSAPGELRLDLEELNAVVGQSLLLVKHELDRNQITLVKELSEDLPPVWLDGNKIQQLFVNLLINATHAMPEGGTLTVKTYAKQLTEASYDAGSRKAERFRIGDTVTIAEVEDTGTGIPENQLTKIFDPFFTTKPTGKGTGLGLTVVSKIIDLHGGAIDIQNRPEGGVRVSLMFRAGMENDGDQEETDSTG